MRSTIYILYVVCAYNVVCVHPAAATAAAATSGVCARTQGILRRGYCGADDAVVVFFVNTLMGVYYTYTYVYIYVAAARAR